MSETGCYMPKDTSANVSVPEGWDTPQLQSFEGILAKSETISAYF